MNVYCRKEQECHTKNSSHKIGQGNREVLNNIKDRFVSPLFRTERSNSRKVEGISKQPKLLPNNKGNILDANKINSLISSIRSSRSNKISKAGTDGVNKQLKYKCDPAVNVTNIEPRNYKYGGSNAHVHTINHQDLYDVGSGSTINNKQSKGLKNFNTSGRHILKQLCSKLRNFEKFKVQYSSNEVIHDFNTIKDEHTNQLSPNNPLKINSTKEGLKKYQKEITMIAKKKRDYIFSQAKKIDLSKFNSLSIKTTQVNNLNNVNMATSSIAVSSGGNPNNLSLDYPGFNESLLSSHNDFDKAKIRDYATIKNNRQASSKKILREINAEIRKKHNGSVDKHKPYEYNSPIDSKRKDKAKKNKKNTQGDIVNSRSSCSNTSSNFPKIQQNIGVDKQKDSKKCFKRNSIKSKGINRNIIAQNRLGRQQLISADNSFAE